MPGTPSYLLDVLYVLGVSFVLEYLLIYLLLYLLDVLYVLGFQFFTYLFTYLFTRRLIYTWRLLHS